MRAAKDEKLRVPDDLRDFLLEKAALYERPDFIPDDPIAVPHRFSDKSDIELAGFIAATLAWGQRKTILASAGAFMDRLDGAPGDFMKHATADDIRAAAKGFVHRTFQPRDAELFLHALQVLAQRHGRERAGARRALVRHVVRKSHKRQEEASQADDHQRRHTLLDRFSLSHS